MENTRPTHPVKLITTDGREVKGTVKRPNNKLRGDVRKVGRKITLMNEEYTATFQGSTAINQSIADARVAGDEEALAKAYTERDALEGRLEQMDVDQYKLMNERYAMIINVPKNDAEHPPEIAWDECDEEELYEALNFFTVGKAK